jgi:hypothetical protein
MNVFSILVIAIAFSSSLTSACKSRSPQNPVSTIISKSDSNGKKITISQTDSTYELRDDSLYKVIEQLAEVRRFIQKINLRGNTQKVQIMITKRPDQNFNFYWIQVGIDDNIRFQPVYNFYVSKNFQVNFYDTQKDSVISLQKWRSDKKE